MERDVIRDRSKAACLPVYDVEKSPKKRPVFQEPSKIAI
jgi:hypothetical protein